MPGASPVCQLLGLRVQGNPYTSYLCARSYSRLRTCHTTSCKSSSSSPNSFRCQARRPVCHASTFRIYGFRYPPQLLFWHDLTRGSVRRSEHLQSEPSCSLCSPGGVIYSEMWDRNVGRAPTMPQPLSGWLSSCSCSEAAEWVQAAANALPAEACMVVIISWLKQQSVTVRRHKIREARPEAAVGPPQLRLHAAPERQGPHAGKVPCGVLPQVTLTVSSSFFSFLTRERRPNG